MKLGKQRNPFDNILPFFYNYGLLTYAIVGICMALGEDHHVMVYTSGWRLNNWDFQ